MFWRTCRSVGIENLDAAYAVSNMGFLITVQGVTSYRAVIEWVRDYEKESYTSCKPICLCSSAPRPNI